MPIEDAKRQVHDVLAKVDPTFTYRLDVYPLSEYDPGCKPDTACRIDPERWYLAQERSITIYVNKKLSISDPNN